MGWFSKKKEVEVVTKNVLCVNLTESRIFKIAEDLINTIIAKENATRKKTKKLREEEYDMIYGYFSREVEEQFPWIKVWKLQRRAIKPYEYTYYLEALEINEGVEVKL